MSDDTHYAVAPAGKPKDASSDSLDQIKARWEGAEREWEEWTGMGSEYELEGREHYAQRDVLILLGRLATATAERDTLREQLASVTMERDRLQAVVEEVQECVECGPPASCPQLCSDHIEAALNNRDNFGGGRRGKR